MNTDFSRTLAGRTLIRLGLAGAVVLLLQAGAIPVVPGSLAATVVALTLLLAAAAWILRRQVGAPVAALAHAAERLAAGDVEARLPRGRDDELGRLARAFNGLADKVAARDAALGSVLSGVAHELNNPLAVVVGRAAQLEAGAAVPADRETARRIRHAAERCADIVRRFLAMAPQHPTVRDPADAMAGAGQLGHVLMHLARAHSGTVRFVPAPGGGTCFVLELPDQPEAAHDTGAPRRPSVWARLGERVR